MTDTVTEITEIRNLPPSITEQLSDMLDIRECWKRLIEKILSPEDGSLLYKAHHVPLLQKHPDGPTKALIADWGTHGRERPNVKTLISLLCDCELFEAADYLAVNILKGNPVPKNHPNTTKLMISDDLMLQNPELPQNPDGSDNDRRDGPTIPQWPYNYLIDITNNFNERNYSEGGRGLGSGKFSTVHLGVIDQNTKVAVKKVHQNFDNQLYNEIKVLSRIQHENLLRLIAYSADGCNRCLIYEYMVNGNLQDRLARLFDKPPLTVKHRVAIAAGVAQGLTCLHNQSLIHRDIKSANILLDENMTPKLGDFGIVHIGPTMNSNIVDTSLVFGTPPYLPEEAYRGLLSYRLDVFSYGVVLLELISGKKPIDSNSNDIISYFQDHCSEESQLVDVLDQYAGIWDLQVANKLYTFSQNCLKPFDSRPEIFEVSQGLKKMKNKKSVSGTEDMKRWPYFSALSFIVPSLQAARTQFNLYAVVSFMANPHPGGQEYFKVDRKWRKTGEPGENHQQHAENRQTEENSESTGQPFRGSNTGTFNAL